MTGKNKDGRNGLLRVSLDELPKVGVHGSVREPSRIVEEKQPASGAEVLLQWEEPGFTHGAVVLTFALENDCKKRL
jgi:hypothetical protein